HIDHAQPRLPQKQQENKEPLLVGLLQGATSLVDAVHANGGNDNDGLALLVLSHDLPDAAHPVLEAAETFVAFLLAELCQRRLSRRSGSHEATLAESGLATSEARIDSALLASATRTAAPLRAVITAKTTRPSQPCRRPARTRSHTAHIRLSALSTSENPLYDSPAPRVPGAR